MTSDRSAVGLIGLGMMGRLMAEALVERDSSVIAVDPSPEAQQWARNHAIDIEASPRLLADRVDICLLSLPGPDQVRETVAGRDGILEGNRAKVIVDLTTSQPETTRELAKTCAGNGVELIDAPVLGRPRSVGEWMLPVGGDQAALERARPTLEAFAAAIHHVGPVGSGHAVKLLNMLMFGAINAATAEALTLSSRVGVDPRVFCEVLLQSKAATVSGLFREIAPKIAQREFSPIFTVDLLSKDVRLAVEMCEAEGAPPVLGSLVKLLNELALAQGLGQRDTSAIALVFDLLSSPDRSEDDAADA